MHDCHMDHLPNCHHDGNVGHIATPESLKYCCNSGKVLYIAIELEKIKTNEDVKPFLIGISSLEMKKYLNLNYNYSYSKNMQITNSLNPTHLALPNDIGFDAKSKQDIKIYIVGESSKETVERYIIQQLQLQLQLQEFKKILY